jgi:hypothetical protein
MRATDRSIHPSIDRPPAPGAAGPNRDGAYGLVTGSVPFISLDDPDDTGATACAAGYWGLYADVGIGSPDYHDYYGCYECPPGQFDLKRPPSPPV